MCANVRLDNRLIDAAVKIGGHRTKKAAVTAALAEYIQRRRRAEIVKLFGQINYGAGYDYKFALPLSQLLNRYLDSPMRFKMPLSRYLTTSTTTNAPTKMFTARSSHSGMSVSPAGF